MKIDPYCQQRNCIPLNLLFSDGYVDIASLFSARGRQTTLRWQKQVFVHTRLSCAYLALARLSCSIWYILLISSSNKNWRKWHCFASCSNKLAPGGGEGGRVRLGDWLVYDRSRFTANSELHSYLLKTSAADTQDWQWYLILWWNKTVIAYFSIFADEMYSTTCVYGLMIISVLVWRKSIHFWRR